MGSGDLRAFVAQLLKPVPKEDLHDQDYNRMMRRDRTKVWRQREAVWRMRRAARNLYQAKRILDREHGRELTYPDIKDLELWEAIKQARDDLLFTPAPDRAALAWKKKHLPYIHDQSTDEEHAAAEEVERTIADDEVWLAAHLVRKPNRRAAS